MLPITNVSSTEMPSPPDASKLLLGICFVDCENSKKMLSMCLASPKALGTTAYSSLMQNILWQENTNEETEKL